MEENAVSLTLPPTKQCGHTYYDSIYFIHADRCTEKVVEIHIPS